MVWWTPIRLLVRILLERILCKVNIFYQDTFLSIFLLETLFNMLHYSLQNYLCLNFFFKIIYISFSFFFWVEKLTYISYYKNISIVNKFIFHVIKLSKAPTRQVKWVLTNSWKKSCFKEEGQKMQHTMIKIDCFSKLHQCFNFVKQP